MDTGFYSYANVATRSPVGPDAHRPAHPGHIMPPWANLLDSAIETDILPRLLGAHRDETEWPAAGLSHAGIAAFVDLLIADEIEDIRAIADRMIVTGGGRDALLRDLLTPAAQYLGELWERDDCDFVTVTLGIYRLDQIMKETASFSGQSAAMSGHERRILLLPAPGEQHSFGIAMVADAFREGGWCVRAGPATTRAQLLALVKDEYFDIVGLSISSDRALKCLQGCIRAVRNASRNPKLCVMLGGHAILQHQERSRFLGADLTANSAAAALATANAYIETAVTNGLRQSMTRLVDIG